MRPALALALALAAVAPASAGAQASGACGVDQELSPWAYVRTCLAPLFPADTATLAQALQDGLQELKDPETLNSELGEVEYLTGTRGLFRGLHLEFANLQEDGEPQVGVRYDWTRPVARAPHRQGRTHWGWNLEVEATGLVAPIADQNPEPVLVSTLFPHLFLGFGGAIDPAAMAGHLDDVTDSIAAYEAADDLVRSGALTGLLGAIWDSLSTQAYITGGLDARYETDQAFDRDQWAYGVKAGVDIKAWQPGSALARFNVFDWPAALVRWGSGVDDAWRPSGAAIPTLEVGLHRVSPGTNPERLAVVALDEYTRLRAELRYRSVLTRTGDAPVWLEMAWHHHRELDPHPAVEDAGLHQHDRFFVLVRAPSGFTASWATGAVPLDADGSDVWGLGFHLKF